MQAARGEPLVDLGYFITSLENSKIEVTCKKPVLTRETVLIYQTIPDLYFN